MALFRTTEEFKKYVAVNKSLELTSLQPDVDLVEDEQIRRLMGDDFYEEFHQRYQDGSLSELLLKLLASAQLALANLAMASYLDINQVQISNSGVQIISTGDKKTAFKWQINDLKKSFLQKGFNGLEKMLQFLDRHVDNAELAAWANSPAAIAHKRLFITSAAEFSREYNINGSRITYLALTAIIRKQERFLVEPVLGGALFDELKEQVLDSDVVPENEKLLENFIRPALAHLTVGQALVEGGYQLEGDAVQLKLYLQNDTADKRNEQPDPRLLETKKAAALADGQAYLTKLRDYLNANASADRYAAYFNSPLYAAPGNRPDVVVTNTGDRNFFAAF